MVIPIRDDNPTRTKPVLTIAIIAACLYIFAAIQPHQSGEEVEFLARHAAIPCEVVHADPISNELSQECDGQLQIPGLPGSVEPFPDKNVFLAVVVSMFLHGSWLHVLGNMLFLWVFGDNVEDAMGHIRYLFFYLACAAGGAFLHGIIAPDSQAPLIGASGAIAGIVTAYLILHPRVKIWILAFARIPLRLPAWIVLALWILFQFAMIGLRGEDEVSWAAHIGGIVTGAVLVLFLRRKGVPLFDREVVTPKAAEVETPLVAAPQPEPPSPWGRRT